MKRALLITLALVAAAGCRRHKPRYADDRAARPYLPPPEPEPEPPKVRSPADVLADAQDAAARKVAIGAMSRDEIVDFVVDKLAGDAPSGFDLRPAVEKLTDALLADQRRRERTWKRTDCDRLDAAWAALTRRGILVCQDCDFDQEEERARAKGRKLRGWLYFDADDLEAAYDGTLELDYGAYGDDTDEGWVAVADEAARALRAQKLNVEWTRDIDDRLIVKDLTWQKRRFTRAR